MLKSCKKTGALSLFKEYDLRPHLRTLFTSENSGFHNVSKSLFQGLVPDFIRCRRGPLCSVNRNTFNQFDIQRIPQGATRAEREKSTITEATVRVV